MKSKAERKQIKLEKKAKKQSKKVVVTEQVKPTVNATTKITKTNKKISSF